MLNPITTLTAFVVEKLDNEPPAKRISIYRALATLEPIKDNAARLRAAADELEAIERKHQQLVLDFKRRAL